MKLTTNELTLFRNILLSRRALATSELPGQARVWEPWMESTLRKVTDELYPQEFDVI